MTGVGCPPRRDHLLAPRLVLLGLRGPRDVVHRAGARQAARRGRVVVDVERAALLAARLPAGREAEPRRGTSRSARSPTRRRARPRSRAARAPRGISGCSAISGSSPESSTTSSSASPSGSWISTAAELALAARALGPEVERLLGGDAEDDAVHHPVAGAAARRARVLEEGDVGAGAAALVGIEEVVDGRVVLVHRLLHEPQPERARIELDVRRRIAGDARDVVDSFEAHVARILPTIRSGR